MEQEKADHTNWMKIEKWKKETFAKKLIWWHHRLDACYHGNWSK